MKNYYHTRVRPRLKQLQTGLGIKRTREKIGEIPPDFDELTREVYKTVAPFTMTSAERIAALVETVRYVVANGLAHINANFLPSHMTEGFIEVYEALLQP